MPTSPQSALIDTGKTLTRTLKHEAGQSCLYTQATPCAINASDTSTELKNMLRQMRSCPHLALLAVDVRTNQAFDLHPRLMRKPDRPPDCRY